MSDTAQLALIALGTLFVSGFFSIVTLFANEWLAERRAKRKKIEDDAAAEKKDKELKEAAEKRDREMKLAAEKVAAEVAEVKTIAAATRDEQKDNSSKHVQELAKLANEMNGMKDELVAVVAKAKFAEGVKAAEDKQAEGGKP